MVKDFVLFVAQYRIRNQEIALIHSKKYRVSFGVGEKAVYAVLIHCGKDVQTLLF